MEESEKSKKRNELKKLEALERHIKAENQKKIQELTKEVSTGKVSYKEFLKVLLKKRNDLEEE